MRERISKTLLCESKKEKTVLGGGSVLIRSTQSERKRKGKEKKKVVIHANQDEDEGRG